MSDYYSDEPRSNFGLYFFLGVLALCLISIGLFATQCSGAKQLVENDSEDKPENSEAGSTPEPEPTPPSPEPEPEPEPTPPDSLPPQTAAEILADLGQGAESLEPADLIKQIGEALEKQEIDQAAKLIGKPAVTPHHVNHLKGLTAGGAFRMHPVRPVTEIGELEANRRARWALNLDDDYGSRIYFDLHRRQTGKWAVETLRLPPKVEPGQPIPRALLVDSLGITDAFLQAALKQEFDDAKSFVDSSKVSDAKIAGLCIIFEEGKYRLRQQKPLRSMFNRDTTAGFVAHVETDDGERAAEFGINVQRETADKPWRVTEINLESLLADYANRVAGGDVHFTPLVKNPAGGDTLILYFGFDEDGLTPRTTRQLDIVAMLLKTDPNKKLTLSGHTDSLGSDNYNDELSSRRADAVKAYILESGVPDSQIITVAEGEAKPRLPNETDAGEDNPTGRRANRRTEIYLDF